MRLAFIIFVLTSTARGVQKTDSPVCAEAQEAFGQEWDCVSREPLGQGYSSLTFLVQHTNGTFAVLKKTKLKNSEIKLRTRTEVELFPKLNNKYIVKQYGAVYLESHNAMYQLLEHGTYGSLTSFKKSQPLFFTNPLALLHVCHGIASGLKYLHSQKIVHGDLKNSNVVLSADFTPKLIDFDLAREMGADALLQGTPLYLDPRFFYKENSMVTYDADVDIYALGTTLYLLSQDWLPAMTSPNPTSTEVADWVSSEPYVINRGTELTVAYIINRCRQDEAEDRLTIDEILSLTAKALQSETVTLVEKTEMNIDTKIELSEFKVLNTNPASNYKRPWGFQTYESPDLNEIEEAKKEEKGFSFLDFFSSINFLCNKPRKRILGRSETEAHGAPHPAGFGWLEVGKLVVFFGVVCLASHFLVRGVQRMWFDDLEKGDSPVLFGSLFEGQDPPSVVQPTFKLELSS